MSLVGYPPSPTTTIVVVLIAIAQPIPNMQTTRILRATHVHKPMIHFIGKRKYDNGAFLI
jgi:hypothetical protein